MDILLIALPVEGCIWFLFLFLLCFIGVHVLQLARIGWSYKKQTEKKAPPSPPPPPKEEKKAPASQEPVYYIVERKTRRTKSAYTEPKRIHFKND